MSRQRHFVHFACSLACLLLGLGVLASASPITVTMGTNTNDYGGPNSTLYYYPYVLNVNGVNMNVACDDYLDEVKPGESWQANVSTVSGDLSGTMFGTADTLQYKEAAWLFTQFQPTPPEVNTVNEAINYAMWDLFEGAAPGVNTGTPTLDTSSTYWLNQASVEAAAGFSGVDFSDFVIYTPASGWPNSFESGEPQEYIGEVPEPSTVFLMLTGLAGLAFLAWKRRPEEALACAGDGLDAAAL